MQWNRPGPEEPKDVVAARKTIAAWEKKTKADNARSDNAVREAAIRASEAINFGEPTSALALVKALEALVDKI